MREMARVLKPGGGLVVTAAALDVLRGGHAGTWPEVRRYTTARMRAIVEGAGLQVAAPHVSVRDRCFRRCSRCGCFAAIEKRRTWPETRGGSETDWEMRVPPAPINAALTWMLSGEAALSRHVPMPVGSSVLVVARK